MEKKIKSLESKQRYICTYDLYLFVNDDAEALRDATIIAERIERFAEHCITDVEVLKIEQKNLGELKVKEIYKLNK